MSDISSTASTDTRARLIEAAAAAFFEAGYNVSMDAIAARAGVAKQTLYNHFASKSLLFSEVVRRDTERMTTALEGRDEDVRPRLVRFGLAFRTLVVGARCLALHRTLIAESVRFPEMARAFYDSGPAQTLQELTQLLDEEMKAGRLRDDGLPGAAAFAADMLLTMLRGSDHTRYLLCLEQCDRDADALLLLVERVIDCFLRAFAPTEAGEVATPARSRSTKR